MIKDIVVNLSLGARDPAGDYAVSMAEACDAHVLGVAFAYEPVIPGSAMGGIPAEFLDAQRREAGDKARMAMARFTEAAKRAGVTAETPARLAASVKRAIAMRALSPASRRCASRNSAGMPPMAEPGITGS